MLKYRIVGVILGVAALMAGYELGKGSRAADTRERSISPFFASGTASNGANPPNTWQKITARAKPLHEAASNSSRRNDQRTELPSGPFGQIIPELKRLADAGDAD